MEFTEAERLIQINIQHKQHYVYNGYRSDEKYTFSVYRQGREPEKNAMVLELIHFKCVTPDLTLAR